MLDRTIRFASEALARKLSRRTFLQRASASVTSGVAALMMGSLLTNSPAYAASKGPAIPNITCSPPGPYCNTGGGSLSGCHGAHCYKHLYNGTVYRCHVYYQYYAGGCWTSGDGWTCCDCQCGSPTVTTCGCAQQHSTPAALSE